MTVKELIRHLQTQDPNAEIGTVNYRFSYINAIERIVVVQSQEIGKVVCLGVSDGSIINDEYEENEIVDRIAL